MIWQLPKFSKRRFVIIGAVTFVSSLFTVLLSAVITYLDDTVVGRYEQSVKLCESSDPNSLKVLFVGNSLIYANSLPRQFAYMCQANQIPVRVYQAVAPGETWSDHVEREDVLRLLATTKL